MRLCQWDPGLCFFFTRSSVVDVVPCPWMNGEVAELHIQGRGTKYYKTTQINLLLLVGIMVDLYWKLEQSYSHTFVLYILWPNKVENTLNSMKNELNWSKIPSLWRIKCLPRMRKLPGIFFNPSTTDTKTPFWNSSINQKLTWGRKTIDISRDFQLILLKFIAKG